MNRILVIVISAGIVALLLFIVFRDVDHPDESDETYHPPLQDYWEAIPNSTIGPNTPITGEEVKQLLFLSEAPSDIDHVHVTEVMPVGKPSRQKTLFKISGKGLFRELESFLEFKDTQWQNLGYFGHACRGDANIYFLRNSTRSPLRWNFAHGSFVGTGLYMSKSGLHLCDPETNAQLLDWFESKGYNQFRVWHNKDLERKKANQRSFEAIKKRGETEQRDASDAAARHE